jgi:hypothetical protein
MSVRDAPSLRLRNAYGHGIFRRHIFLRSTGARAEGNLEDDFHRFRVRIEHDGSHVTRAEAEASRFPWTTCPGAVDPLRRLVGMPLARSSRAAHGHTDPRAQCTHLLDLAGLTIARAAAGRSRRSYAIEIPDRVRQRTRALLGCDGRERLHFEIENATIVASEPFAGWVIRGSAFSRWAEAALDPDLAEAAIALHRACSISIGRCYDMDAVEGAWLFGSMAGRACHTFWGAFTTSARLPTRCSRGSR